MKFPSFEYVAAKSVTEVLEILAAQPDARPLAGGQSLLPLLAVRLSTPSVLIDLERIEELTGIVDGGEVIRIGAMARQAECEQSELVRQRLPLLAQALSYVAHPAIRNRGTIGGSLAHADPAAELPVVMTALDAVLVVVGPSGERVVPAADFFVGHFETSLRPGELLVRVDIPVSPYRWNFSEVARRQSDFAMSMVAVGLDIRDTVCHGARVVLGAVARTPVRAHAAEALLVGAPTDAPTLAEAARESVAQLSPSADVQASAEYRRDVTAVLVRRALTAVAGSTT